MDGAGNAFVDRRDAVERLPDHGRAPSTGPGRARYDMFVTKLNPAGSALVYSTFLGGAQVDNGQSVAVDSGGNAYALGSTSSADFPTTAGAFDTDGERRVRRHRSRS